MESHNFFKDLVDNSPDAIAVHSQGTFLYANRSALELFELNNIDELKEKKLFDIIKPENRTEAAKRIKAVYEKRASFKRIEERLISFKGREFDAELSSAPITCDDGKKAAYVTIRDVSEKKDFQKALGKSETRYKELTDLIPVMVFETDKEGNAFFVNKTVRSITGYSEDDLKSGINILDCLAYFDRERGKRNLIRRLQGSDFKPEEYTAMKKDGSFYPCFIITRPIYNNSEISGVMGVVVDISELKKTQEKLFEKEELYRQVVEKTDQGIGILQDDIFMYVNSRLADIVGTDRDILLDKPFSPYIHPESLDNLMECFQDFQEDRRDSFRSDMVINSRGDNKVHVEIEGREISYGGKRALLMFIKDVSRRWKVNKEIIKAEKLDSLSVMAGGIAHDFNNMLTAIITSISLSKLGVEGDNEMLESLEGAENAAKRAVGLTKQLQAFSKGCAPVKEKASLTELLRETATFASRGSKVRCRFDFQEDLFKVDMDIGQISEVIHNLVLNAVQAMPKGGVVFIKAGNARIKRKSSIPLKEGRYCVFSVEDSGTGISQENYSKIFDPFFTTKERGSGLGLSSSYSIVKNHKGHIAVNSTVGKGTLFSVYLPVSEKNDDPLKVSKHNMQSKDKTKTRILVLDDDEGVCRSYKLIFKHLGYAADFTHDGAETLKKYFSMKESGRPYRLLILDLTVPGGMGGFEAAGRILEKDPGAGIIVASGYTNSSVMTNYRDHGFRSAIVKPFEINRLKDSIEKALECQNG